MPRNGIVPGIALAFTLMFPLGAGAVETDKWAEIEVAKVNGESVKIKDLRSQFKNRHGGHTKFLGGEEELRTFLRIAIEDRLLLQEAYELGLDEDPLVKGESEAFENGKVADYFVDAEVVKKSEPGAEEIQAVWQNYADFLVQVREIGVETRAEAEEVRAALLRGADPDALARSCSLLMTRTRGGLRLVAWGGDPQREALIFALKPGEVSPVLTIDGGFEVIMGEGRVDAMRPELATVKDAIAAILRKRKKEAREKEVSSEAWARYHATIVAGSTDVATIAKLFQEKPDTIVATWDGGQLAVRQATSREELNAMAALAPADGARQVEARIRATVNASLFAMEGRARKMTEVPQVANAVTDHREKLMLDALYGEHILKEFKVADDEVRAYFDAKKSDFSEPEKRRMAQILVSSEGDAKSVVAALAKGGDFAELAKSRSRDITTASSGGDLGWVTADHVPPLFGAVLTLQAGQYTQPVRTSSGWHIIKVVEVAPKRLLTFDEAKGMAAEAVSEQKKRTMRDAWLKKLHDAATIEVDDNAIREFVKANPLDQTKPAPSMQHAKP
jgi:peptidyl-prolyl cis-trans isomerase C